MEGWRLRAAIRHVSASVRVREAAVQVSVVDMGRGSRPGDLHRRRVLLVAESAGLAAVLHHLLDPADRLSRIGSLRELAESRALEAADVVVLDVPPEDRVVAVGQVRRRYLGPLVVLVDRADGPGGLRPDAACRLLPRPFSAEELGAALAGPTIPGAAPRILAPAAEAAAAPADPVDPADPKAAARRAPVQRAAATPRGQLDLVDRALRLLAGLTQGWQARRRVRVAGFSAFALVAFTVAFAVASQGGRCGPGCDAFGTGFSPAPTIAPASSLASSTTGAKRATSTTVRAGSPATGAFQGISGGRVAVTSTTRARVTTTTRRPATTRPATTRPATTRPATTQTTAPAPTTTTEPVTTTIAGA
jgi:hypothetical protein